MLMSMTKNQLTKISNNLKTKRLVKLQFDIFEMIQLFLILI